MEKPQAARLPVSVQGGTKEVGANRNNAKIESRRGSADDVAFTSVEALDPFARGSCLWRPRSSIDGICRREIIKKTNRN